MMAIPRPPTTETMIGGVHSGAGFASAGDMMDLYLLYVIIFLCDLKGKPQI